MYYPDGMKVILLMVLVTAGSFVLADTPAGTPQDALSYLSGSDLIAEAIDSPETAKRVFARRRFMFRPSDSGQTVIYYVYPLFYYQRRTSFYEARFYGGKISVDVRPEPGPPEEKVQKP